MTLLHQAAQKAVEALTEEEREHIHAAIEMLGDYEATARISGNDSIAEGAGATRYVLQKLFRFLPGRTLQQQPEPVHPNHRPDLRYVLMVLEKWHNTRATDDEIAAAMTGMRYIIKRTEEAATPPALQHQEVPREPVANPSEQHFRERIDAYADKHPSLLVRQLGTLLRAAWLAASPSTTQQQEAGNGWLKEAERLAMEFAHCYAFVGDDTMPKAKAALMAHLRASAPSTPERAEKDDAGGGKDHGNADR